MRSIKLLTIAVFASLSLSSCITLVPGDIHISRVSMLEIKNPHQKFVKIAQANEKYCRTESPALDKHGFVDELVTKALNKYNGHAIDNAVFKAEPLSGIEKYSVGAEYNFGDCWTMTGDVMKIK